MTQERIDKIFASDFGQQFYVLFSTSDDRVFVRYEEAVRHTRGELDPNTLPLDDPRILDWAQGDEDNTTYHSCRDTFLTDTEKAVDWWKSLPVQNLIDMSHSWVGYVQQYYPTRAGIYALTDEEIEHIWRQVHKIK